MSVKLNLFKSMIIPVLIYGSSCWYANIDNLKSLEKVQKRALKWVCSDRNSTYKELLLIAGILPLWLYMQLQDLVTLSKCMTGYFDIDFNPYLCLRNCTRDIRSSHDVRFDHCKPRKSQSEQSFFRTGALIDRLPATIDINNPTGLKQRLLRVLWTSSMQITTNLSVRCGECNLPSFTITKVKGRRSPCQQMKISPGRIPITTTTTTTVSNLAAQQWRL